MSPTLADLTPRQLQVIRLLASGMTEEEVARQLRLSVLTVNAFRRNALKRLGVNLRAAIAMVKAAE